MTIVADEWRAALQAWALPEELLAAAPVSPWGHDPAVFADRARRARRRDLPPDRLARQAVPLLGSVLDVGCGGGAAVVALGARGRQVIGVDRSPRMLDAFEHATRRWWRRVTCVQGSWPDVEVATADVVVCHDVVYDVPDLEPFVTVLTDHARRRVVLVLPQRHPMSWLNPYFGELHGLSRPERPTADDAVAVIAATGVEPHVVRYRDATRWGTPGASTPQETIASVRWRLGLPPDRDADVAAVLARIPPPTQRDVVTVWWNPRG